MTRALRVPVLVIGGGINGAGIARDLCLRGIECALVEKGEFGGGTTWASSGMIHGGLRYLQKDPEVTLHSCQDSGAIQRIAPHLIFRIPFLLPVFPEDPIGPELVEIGLELYDRYQPLKNGRPHTRLNRTQAMRIEPALSPSIECAFSLDEWGVDAARLTAANALDAAERGAQVMTGVEVVALLRGAGGRVEGATLRDVHTGEAIRVEAEWTINATGPWAPALARLADVELRLRPSKGIHLVFERRVSDVAVYARGIDGRDMFTFPHEQNSMAGTTDDDFYGDLDDPRVEQDEIRYVLQAMERSLPGVSRHRILHAIAGVRPTLYRFGVYESDLSRDYAILDHGTRDGAPGFLSLVGGKLAAYRLMAEAVCDQVAARLGVREPCRSAVTPLPGGDAPVDVGDLSRRFRVSRSAALRVAMRHGTRSPVVLEEESSAESPRTLCVCEPVLDRELLFAARREGVRSLSDCSLRVRLGVGACEGMQCAAAASALLAEPLAWDATRRWNEVRRFVEARWRAVQPTLGGDQIAAMDSLRHTYRGLGTSPLAGVRAPAPGPVDDVAEETTP